MKLDAARLAAEADAKEARMHSAAWADTPTEDENWLASLTQGDVVDPQATAPSSGTARRARARPAVPPELHPPHEDLAPSAVDLGEITAQLDAMGRTLQALSEGMARLRAERRIPAPPDGIPTWLQEAAGDPLTYDAPDPARITVCVRIRPAHYARLQLLQARLGLRTTAGAWEYLLRLGTAASERLGNVT
jgi:hypothetical protein